jgi:hypothetical protein
MHATRSSEPSTPSYAATATPADLRLDDSRGARHAPGARIQERIFVDPHETLTRKELP